MTYQILAGIELTETVYTPYGGCEEFFYCKEPEYIAAGPAETGKTLAACWKIHLLALKYPGLNGAILRKTQTSVYGSVLQTFERVIDGAPVSAYGGEKQQKYNYSNGSVIWVGGMDKSDKILSSERDFFYVNQAEELSLDDWEKLTTRTTGRGAIMPYTMTFGDCNPGGSKHWIRERAKVGDLRLITTTHMDNPTLFDPGTGEITAQGQRSISQLEKLTGVRRKRLLEGIWATAEGAVYDMFDVAKHVINRDPEEMKTWYLGLDEGYTNPAVILLVGEDSDGRHHIHKEWYKRGKLQSEIVDTAYGYYTEYDVSLAAVDNAAAGLIADMRDKGMNVQGSKGRVKDRIDFVQNRLKIQEDNRTRLTIDPSCTCTINDFESRAWKPEKDEPIKADDHGTDAYEYIELATRNSGIQIVPNPFYK